LLIQRDAYAVVEHTNHGEIIEYLALHLNHAATVRLRY
jgi:hypothetical protein